jgi:hypothetical protein
MIGIDKLLTSGIGFVLGKIATAVDAEMNDDDNLRDELLGAQMKLELGEITEEEYEKTERSVMDALRERRLAKEEESGVPRGALEAAHLTVESIDADVGAAPPAHRSASPVRSPKPKAKARKKKR